MELLSKKTIERLGSRMNEQAPGAAEVSSFAKRQMLKMGWVEGRGLGKHEDGIQKHVTVTKREEAVGLGSEKAAAEDPSKAEGWWYDAMSSNLKMFKNVAKGVNGKDKKKEKKEKKEKKDKRKEGEKRLRNASDDDGSSLDRPSYDALFRATGGVMVSGKGQGAKYEGKWRRTGDTDSA